MPMLLSGLRLRISTRLTLWYGLTLLILLSLFALFSYVYFLTTLDHDFDRHLAHEKRQLLPYVRITDDAPAFTRLDELRSVAYQTDGAYGTFVRLATADGEVVYRSPNFEGHLPLGFDAPDAARESTVSRNWGGEAVRSVYTPLRDDARRVQGWLEVTGFEWTLHQELANLRTSMLAGVLLGVLLAIGGGYLLAKRALQPVASLTEAAREIHAKDLSTRLPTSFGLRDELTDLAETFNNMIERIEASFERERRFTNNAAHEILTPLATIQNSAEIALRRERTPDSYRQVIGAILKDAAEMTDTVRGLLQLARIDRIEELPRDEVDLALVVKEHTNRMRERARSDAIVVDAQVNEPVMVMADAGRLGEVVENLIDNALKYTPSEGRVSISVARQDGTAHLAVTDTGVGFEPEQAEHLFDRFYRADLPEVQARSGSGLGLAIVKAIVELYGGRVSACSEGRGMGSRFDVELPVASSSERNASVDFERKAFGNRERTKKDRG